MQRCHQAIAVTAIATFLLVAPWLAGSAEFGASPAHAFGGGGGGPGGGGGGGAGGGPAGAGPSGVGTAGAHGAATAAAATSSQTSGLGKASAVVGTTPAADDAQSGLAAAIGAAEGATPSPTLDRGR